MQKQKNTIGINRTEQDKKFLRQTLENAEGSLCFRKRVAAAIVKKGKVLISCCNDPLPAYDCKKLGCIRDQMNIPHGHRREICYGICAEMYCIARLAQSAQSLKGSTIYVTAHPCKICSGIISQSGIKRVVYAEDYPNVIPNIDTLLDHGIEVLRIPTSLVKEEEKRKTSRKT